MDSNTSIVLFCFVLFCFVWIQQWYDERRKRPPLAFTLIACSDQALVVRGSKTGGMAIFRRIPDDMRPCAYGDTDDGQGRIMSHKGADGLEKVRAKMKQN